MVAGMVALSGILSLLDAAAVVAGWVSFDGQSDSRSIAGGAAALISAVLGLVLLHRAHGLWNLKRSAWAITLALLSLRSVMSGLSLVASPNSVQSWLGLLLPVLALLYLLQPDVRALFRGGGNEG